MSKENRQLILKWLISTFVLHGFTSKVWRVGLTLMISLNIVLFMGWKWPLISAFLGELGPIYGETGFPPQRVNDLRVNFSGPTMLVETANSQATVLICNDGQNILHNIHLALVSPNGEVRVSGGSPDPNSLRVTELLAGATHEHTFMLTTIKAFSSTITPTLDLHIEYRFMDPEKVTSQRLTGVYSFEIGRFASLHRTIAQGKKVSTGITSLLGSLTQTIQTLVGALVGLGGAFGALLIKPYRDFVSKLIGRGVDKQKNDTK